MFGFVDLTVQVGINTNMCVSARHGVASVETVRGALKVPFNVDLPNRLKHPATETVLGMFNQFRRLGLTAHTIEIRVGKLGRVYSIKDNSPVLVQSFAA